MNILLVEDNLSIVKGLSYLFEKNNFMFVYKTNIRDTVLYLKETGNIDIVILDLTLPDGNGFDLFEQHIKERKIPTIFLTANDDENDIVRGLDIGAEDYVTKPFRTKELMARINKILSRTKKNNLIKVGNVTFDTDRLVLCRDGEKVELTALELKLVNLLFTNVNKVVSRSTILDKIWEWTGNDVDDHTVTVYFKRIREKIGENVIITIKGMGYRIDEK